MSYDKAPHIWIPSHAYEKVKQENQEIPTRTTRIRPLPTGEVMLNCARCNVGSIVDKKSLLDKLIECPNCHLQVKVSKMSPDIEAFLKQKSKKTEVHVPGVGTRQVTE